MKEYYILAFTFLCLLIGQNSYASDWNELDEVVVTGPGSNDPCDPFSTAYDYFTCNPDSGNGSGYDSGDPCDYYSSSYNQYICDSYNDSGDPCDPTSYAYSYSICYGDSGGGNVSGTNPQQSVGKAYVAKSDDKKVANTATSMSVQMPNTCVTSSLEYISKNLGKPINEGVFILNQMQKGQNVLLNGISLTAIPVLINTYFNTDTFTSFKNSIDSGYTVMTDVKVSSNSSHNVVIIGYQSDGDLIYMDPEKGSLREAPAANFNTNYAITIKSVK